MSAPKRVEGVDVKNSVLTTFVLVSQLFVLLGCQTNGLSPSKVLTKPKQNLRYFQEKSLPNGLTLLLVEDQSLPYVSYQLLLRSGASSDPVGQGGLTQMVLSLLSKGTTKKSASQIADQLGQMAADWSAQVTEDFSFLSVGTLAEYQTSLAELFAEILTSPSFEESEIKRLKQQVTSGLMRRTDDPGSFADEILDRQVFGSHVYGRQSHGSLSEIPKITKKNITQHYFRYVRPNQAILAVIGKFSAENVKRVEQIFGEWSSRPVPESALKAVGVGPAGKPLVVEKPALAQVQVRFAQVTVPRQHPDFIPLRIANLILGGHMGSRLMKSIREQRGLTYSIQSDFAPMFLGGSWAIRTSTRPEKMAEAVLEIQKLNFEFAQNGVTEEELALAKNLMIGRFPQAVETAEKLSQQLLILRHYGIPDDYLMRFSDLVQDVSLKALNKAIRTHFLPQNMQIVVLGDPVKLRDQLSALGEVDRRGYKDYQ